MFRTLITVAILAATTAFLLTAGSVLAKGPFSLEISGGDLVEPVTVDGPVADAGMFGAQIADPQPHPDVIYTVDFFTVDGHQPAGAISYFPAHDGLPAAWQTRYGFWAVPAAFNETFEAISPPRTAGRQFSGTSCRAPGWAWSRSLGASAVAGSSRSAGRNRPIARSLAERAANEALRQAQSERRERRVT